MKKKHETQEPPVEERAAADSAKSARTEQAKAEDPRDAEIARLLAREDELLRALAELQNVSRRRKQEAETAIRFASEPFVRELLVVLDDFERALRVETTGADDPFRAGIALVHDRLVKILEREGVEPIRPQGEPFDPTIHDAIAHLPVPDAVPGTVVDVAVPGYRYRDRVLRHAKVVVASDDPAGAPHAEGGEKDAS